MKLTHARRAVTAGPFRFDAARSEHGVVRIWADDDDSLACGLGAAHAHDRLVQMVTARIAAEGRISECLADDDATFAIDLFMRQMGFRREADREVADLDPASRRFAEAYATGVNHILENERRPLELVLVRHHPEPWRAADTLVTIKLMSYLGLAQSQQDVEKLIIQAIHGGADVEALQRFFSPHLDDLDAATVDAIRHLKRIDPLVPPEVRFLPVTPTFIASNNWAIAGSSTASGFPIQCNDPHLECNRLPGVWYEAELHTPDDDRFGATMPGVPGLVMGRTRDLSFGFTYGFMDMVDFFIEECRSEKCRRGDGFVDLEIRRETIRRRRSPAVDVTIRENDLGVLEADPLVEELADGLYLTRAWSGHRGGAAASLAAIRGLSQARTVAEAQRVVREVSISCNWVLADRRGGIGYQQSGLLPDRRHSGVHPVPAWDTGLHWHGLVAPDRLHRLSDPDDGIIVTANNELNPPGGPTAVNLPMGSYRHDRIRELLGASRTHTPATMERIQVDLVSLQAKRFLEIWRPLLPDSLAGRLLAGWDCRYDVASRAATLFEEVWHELVRRICGDRIFGREAWQRVVDETAILADYYHLFDRILLSEDPAWWGERGREEVLRTVFAELLARVDADHVAPWGRRHRVEMTNIFFDGRLPRVLGFDRGPVELPGNRATIVQGGLFTAHGRSTTFAPSWRFITDLGSDTVFTALAGGPSGRRFSRWYTTDVERWLRGGYKATRFRG